MKIALYQEFGEGCRRLTHELLPDTAGWDLLDVPHAGADIASLAADDADTIRSAEVVIASPLSPFPDAIYDPHGQVRLIQLLSAGYDNVDLDRCRTAGQLVTTNGGANAVAVAEHTVMFILAVLRRLPVLDRDMRAGPMDGGQDTRVGAARVGGPHRRTGGHGADWPGGRTAATTVRRTTPIL